MSLQVWIPFTDGTLKQQGLSDATVSSAGTINLTNAGKLGKCITFTSTAGGLTIPPSTMTSFTDACSVSFWFKINDWGTSYATYFQAGTGSTPWNNYIFGFLRYATNSTICFTISNGSSTSNGSYLTSTMSLGVWYHVAITYETGKCRIYLNGELDHEYTTTIVPAFNKITKISVGRSNADSSYQTQCNMNDLRIYDHCLSPMEINELSKGLMLHYPLNRNGWGQENLFSWANNDTGITLNNYNNTGSFTQFSNSLNFDPSTTVGEKYTISFYAKSPNGSTSLMIYNSNGNPKYFNFGSSPYLTSSLGTEWTYFKRTITNSEYAGTGTPSTNTNVWKRIEIYAPNKMGVQVKNIKVEKGEIATPWCPNSSDSSAATIGLDSTIEYDCSGFGNNGTRIGTISWTEDTPKNTVSTTITGKSTKIYVTGLTTSGFGDSYSFSWYSKTPTWSGMMQWGFSDGIRLNGIYNGILWNTGDGSNNPIYVPNTTTQISPPSVNVWHHYVMTGDGTTCKLYVDGELYGVAKTSKAISGTSIYLNGWNNTTRYSHDVYQMSDFRIYATALSDEAVKSLYKDKGYIDNKGNVYGTLHEIG